MSAKTISTAGGQLDFLPTVAYLLGMETLDTIYLGQNLITADEGFAAIQQFLPKDLLSMTTLFSVLPMTVCFPTVPHGKRKAERKRLSRGWRKNPEDLLSMLIFQSFI